MWTWPLPGSPTHFVVLMVPRCRPLIKMDQNGGWTHKKTLTMAYFVTSKRHGKHEQKVTHGDLFDSMGCCIHSRLRQLGRGIPVWQTVWRSMSRSSGMANDKNAHPAMDKLHLAIKHRDLTMTTRAGSNFKICDWSLNIKAAMLDGLRIFPWRTWFPNTHMEVEMGVPQIIHFKRTFHQYPLIINYPFWGTIFRNFHMLRCMIFHSHVPPIHVPVMIFTARLQAEEWRGRAGQYLLQLLVCYQWIQLGTHTHM